MTIGRSNDRASPGTSLHAQWCHVRKARVFTKHKQVDPLPDRDGGGRGGRGRSVHRRAVAL